MKETIFNNSIKLKFPDSFIVLTDEENDRYFYGNHHRLSLEDKGKHILISISKSKNSIFNRFLGIITVANSSLSDMETNLKEYKFIEEYDSTILGETAVNECFSYAANDENVHQYGELSIFKIKNAIYNVYCICRLEDKDESKKLFKEFKDSLSKI